MYRALTWLAKREGVPLDKGDRLGELAVANPVDFDEQGRCFIAGADVTSAIRRAEIDRLVPVVARHPEVREVMRERQRELADDGDVVIEGRDIGTVVVPGRAREGLPPGRLRRCAPAAGSPSGRSSTPTRSPPTCARATRATPRGCSPPSDAIQIDTTNLTVDEVVDQIEQLVRERAPA